MVNYEEENECQLFKGIVRTLSRIALTSLPTMQKLFTAIFFIEHTTQSKHLCLKAITNKVQKKISGHRRSMIT